MKLSRKWLNEFVDLPLEEIDDKAFAEAMTISGSKVEITEDLSQKMKNVKVGKILSIEKHPNSDHMLVTQIDVGESEPVHLHRRMERACGGSDPRGAAQLSAARRREDHQGEASRRALQRYALLHQGAGRDHP